MNFCLLHNKTRWLHCLTKQNLNGLWFLVKFSSEVQTSSIVSPAAHKDKKAIGHAGVSSVATASFIFNVKSLRGRTGRWWEEKACFGRVSKREGESTNFRTFESQTNTWVLENAVWPWIRRQNTTQLLAHRGSTRSQSDTESSGRIKGFDLQSGDVTDGSTTSGMSACLGASQPRWQPVNTAVRAPLPLSPSLLQGLLCTRTQRIVSTVQTTSVHKAAHWQHRMTWIQESVLYFCRPN